MQLRATARNTLIIGHWRVLDNHTRAGWRYVSHCFQVLSGGMHIHSNRGMNKSGNPGSISLGSLRVLSRAGRMRMAPIALRVQEHPQRRVKARYPPRLMNGFAYIRSVLCHELMHASVEVSINEAVLTQKLLHTFVVPICAATRPLDKHHALSCNGMCSNELKGRPQLPKLFPISIN